MAPALVVVETLAQKGCIIPRRIFGRFDDMRFTAKFNVIRVWAVVEDAFPLTFGMMVL